MKNSNILIVEDEQIIAENLRFILNEKGYNFVDVAIDVAEAKSLFDKTSYDLVLMDINLGDHSEIDGIELIKCLLKKHAFSFLYVTANADKKTVEKAQTTNPAGYIIKPFVNAAIYANVEIVLNTLDKQKSFSFVNKGMQQNVLISEIIYIKSDGAYANLHLLDGNKQILRMSLAECLEQYPTIFIRIHKSILVNKNHIIGHTSQCVNINNSDSLKLPLGRSYKQAFIEKFSGRKN